MLRVGAALTAIIVIFAAKAAPTKLKCIWPTLGHVICSAVFYLYTRKSLSLRTWFFSKLVFVFFQLSKRVATGTFF